ncbi:MAG: diaminopimelate epimerase [Parachlamydiaceae bacterium]|nr:diaminopimelate epimerase [Parachlamydiaceae bacterium]
MICRPNSKNKAPFALPFFKYSGCGNDFILIDNRHQLFNIYTAKTEVIVQICHRRLGIGADGIILLENSQKADFRMRIFNADGSEAEMCGNGLRCLVRFIQDLGIPGNNFLIETMHQLIPTTILEKYISAEMPAPKNCRFFEQLQIEETSYIIHYLDTGVPHAIIFVEDLHDNQLMLIAPQIRYHPHFLPKGTNVNFATINSNNEVEVRTYERGVEGETLACGTGAAAVAIAAAHVHGLKSPISIRPKSGDIIYIYFPEAVYSLSEETFLSNPRGLTMSGPAVRVFNGNIFIGI